MTEGVDLYISTIAIAEYCVRGVREDLPLQIIRILPYTMPHAQETARLAGQMQVHRSSLEGSRDAVKGDCKMFAQANVEAFDYFLSSDTKASQLCQRLGEGFAGFRFIDISETPSSVFGHLDFGEV